MNRRDLLKNMAAFGFVTLFPNSVIKACDNSKPLFIVGLGYAGCNMSNYFCKKGVKAQYLSIKDWDETCEDFKTIDMWFQEDYHYVLLAGLGGVTGSYLIENLNNHLLQKNKQVTTLCSQPFTFEGKLRNKRATIALENIQHIPNVHKIELDNLRPKYGNLSMKESFEKADEEVYLLFSQIVK